jgi:hypothetical protein
MNEEGRYWLAQIQMEKMELKEELAVLKSYMGGKHEDLFKNQVARIREHFTSAAEREEIDRFISGILSDVSKRTESLIQKAEQIRMASRHNLPPLIPSGNAYQ